MLTVSTCKSVAPYERQEIVCHGARPSNPSPVKTFAEFFAGIGLMRLALECQGWSISYANDLDVKKYQMYKDQFPDADKHFQIEDIHKIAGKDIPPVMLATASFPCNDLSLAGGREGLRGTQSSAFWGFVRVLEEMGGCKPPIVLLENVTGFLTSHGGSDFYGAMTALNRLGYSVDPFVVDALSFVPQSRQRLFVVAVLDDCFSSKVGRKLGHFNESDFRPKKVREFIVSHPDVVWNIRELPQIVSSKPNIVDILEDLPDDASEWWNEERTRYLLNQMSERHRKIADGMIAGNNWSYGTIFRRIRNKKSMAELRTDGIAGCLRTPRGGSGRQILFKAGFGDYHARLLTPRECARLMGANDYFIDVPLNQALFGFGDAVCVPAIEWIAQHYLNPIVTEFYSSRMAE